MAVLFSSTLKQFQSIQSGTLNFGAATSVSVTYTNRGFVPFVFWAAAIGTTQWYPLSNSLEAAPVAIGLTTNTATTSTFTRWSTSASITHVKYVLFRKQRVGS